MSKKIKDKSLKHLQAYLNKEWKKIPPRDVYEYGKEDGARELLKWLAENYHLEPSSVAFMVQTYYDNEKEDNA